MKHKELSASNPRPNAREDDDRKGGANRRAAEYSCAVTETSRIYAEAKWERPEPVRIASEDLHQVAELDMRATEEQWRDGARERELIGEDRALEADLAALRREDAGREQDGEARRVARASAGSQRAIVSHPENVFHDRAEEELRLLKTAIEQSNESVIIMAAQLDPPGPQIVYVNLVFTKMTGYAPEEVIG